MARTRTEYDQAKIITENAKRKWGSAWSFLTLPEKERILGLEFMALLAAQEESGNVVLDHYRRTARVLLEES